ncbi:hypothetical protein ACQKWADRAFT_288529 [Trichoderma austrokoningii]
MAAYEAAILRCLLLSVCFFFLLRLSRSICLVTHDACASRLVRHRRHTTFSPLRPRGRCIFSPPRTYEAQDASIPGSSGDDMIKSVWTMPGASCGVLWAASRTANQLTGP